MACSDNFPCGQPDPCNEYDNCGCINPTTFECISNPGNLPDIGITNDMNGKEVLTQIVSALDDLQDDKGKVLIDGDDVCPQNLMDKLVPGLNISLVPSGTGCNRKITINSSTGGVAVDVSVGVSTNDTNPSRLTNKLTNGTYTTKTILNPGSNEVLQIDVNPSTLISSDSGNPLTIGTDGGIKTTYTVPDGSETKVVQGVGVGVSGTGTSLDPYIISTNPTIQIARSCFDGVWRDITLVATGNANVVFASGAPKYRYRFDGTIEFKGSITYNVAFGPYSTSNRKFTVTIGNIPATCITLPEQATTVDLKSINYIDQPQASVDQIVQQYGYIIRKASQNIILEFQSSFTNATSKSVVVNFDGAVFNPNF